MITCTRRIQFCAGHRVMGHEGRCAQPHGHNYVALITAMADLDEIGRVIDFGVLKERVGGWVERNWDHGFLLHVQDDQMFGALQAFAGKRELLPKHCALPYNPTAENLARYLLEVVCPTALLETSVEVVEVTVWETENCYATARRWHDADAELDVEGAHG